MLRITTNDSPRVLTFRLEGRLEGPWVRELEQCWLYADRLVTILQEGKVHFTQIECDVMSRRFPMDPAAEHSLRVSKIRSTAMKRTGNWWNLGFVVLGTFLPLLALGCTSTEPTERLSIYDVDRTGTVARIVPPPYPYPSQNRPASGSGHDRRVATNETRVDETSQR